MHRLAVWRGRLSPVWRGSIYPFGYWGVIGMFTPFINVYFAHLGFSGREIGLLSALFPLMTFVVAPAVAAMADRTARRTQVLAISTGGFALTLFLIQSAHTFAAMMVAMAALALMRSPLAPLSDSLITRMAVRYQIDYGQMRRWGALSFALAALIGGQIWQRVGYAPMFVLAGLLLLPVLFSALLLDEGAATVRQHEYRLHAVLRDRTVLAIIIATSLMGATLSMDGAFGGIFIDRLGGGALLVGIVTAVGGFSQFPAMQRGSALARRFGGMPTLLIACTLMALGHAGYTIATVPAVLAGLAVFKGFGFGLFFVSAVRLLDERSPPVWATTVQALMQAGGWGIAPLIAGPLSGIIFDTWGPRAVFATCCTLLIIAGAVVVLMPERRPVALSTTD